MGYSDMDIKSTSKFLRIESGEPHDVRLLNDQPEESLEHFSPSGSIECKGDACTACVDGDEPQQKWTVNVFDFNTQKVKLWKYGVGIAKLIKAIAVTLEEEEQSIMKVDLKIDAMGSGKSKKYSITPRMTAKKVPEGLVLFKIGGDIPF